MEKSEIDQWTDWFLGKNGRLEAFRLRKLELDTIK